MAEIITSIKNPAVQLVRNLLANKKTRDQENAFVVEGVRLAEEAIAAQYKPKLVLYSAQISERGRQMLADLNLQQTKIEEVDADLLDRVSDTAASQGLLMVLNKKTAEHPSSLEPVLVLDQMRDPGNLGTILRSACAFGFKTVLLTPGSVDPYSPKVLRAGMGAHFKLALDDMNAAEIRQFCKINRPVELEILLADTQAQESCWQVDLSRPLCLIIGGEAFGAGPDIRAIVDRNVLIPMQANTESLNAAMAANILMYEVYRQRNFE